MSEINRGSNFQGVEMERVGLKEAFDQQDQEGLIQYQTSQNQNVDSPNIYPINSEFIDSQINNLQSQQGQSTRNNQNIQIDFNETGDQLLLNDNQAYLPIQKPEKKEKKNASFQKSSNVLLKRKLFRIFLLVILELIIIVTLILYYYVFGLKRGEYQFEDNIALSLSIQKCQIKINDYSDDLLQKQDLNFLQTSNVPKDISNNILIMYSLPNSGIPGKGGKADYEVDDNNIHRFTIQNNVDFQICSLEIYVYKKTTFKSLEIDCGKEDCFIKSTSKNIIIDSFTIKGYSVDLNMAYLNTNNINFHSFYGSVEINDAQFTEASIEVSTGDISIQSTKSIEATLDMVKPLFCVSSYSKNTDIASDVKKDDTTCTKVVPFEDTEENSDNVVALRCYKGKVTIKSDGPENNQILTAKNTYGNIYINVLEKIGDSAIFNKNIKSDSSLYGEGNDKIDFSDISKKNLNDKIETAKNPNVYDPIFVLQFGSKYTQSNTFQQWQVSYNPAYSYMKPWWLGTLTYTLLTTQNYKEDMNLSPGFCPYVPQLSQERIIKTQELLDQVFNADSENKKLISLAWQRTVDLPPTKFRQGDSYDGIKQTQIIKNLEDDWVTFTKDKDGAILIDYLSFETNQILQATVVVSVVLAVIVGIVFMVGIVFLINRNYLFLLDHISHIDSYQEIQKQNHYFDNPENQEIKNVEEDGIYKQLKEENNFDKSYKKLQSIDQRQFKYGIGSIIRLFYTLVFLSPPLSAYIDQVVILFSKARTNSISSFYDLLFKREKGQEEGVDEQIHNLEKDSISGFEMKTLYEQYCYLNRLLERKLDEDFSQKLLKQRGFKISIKQDALISYYTYIKYRGQTKLSNSNELKNSLDQFIKQCCKLTKFDCDSIDSLTFEKLYLEFCYSNHLEPVIISERELKREFGIETRLLPQQVVERDSNYNIADPNLKKYNIQKNRVQNNFNFLLSQDLQEFKTMNKNVNEINDTIIDVYTPKGWIIQDLLTVIAHLLFIFLLGIPIISLVIFLRCQQSIYSVVPTSRQIYISDIIYNIYLIPIKLINDQPIVQFIAVISIVFWALSTWDLMFYYIMMSFPQERYFQNYSQAKLARKIVSRVMWIIVLIAIYLIVVYICLTITWLILGAIINPEAFLPYASSVATLVTLVTKKYHDFKNLSQNGYEKLMQYIKEISFNQFTEIIKKMDISVNVDEIIPTNQIKGLVEEAANLNIIDEDLSQSIQNNIEILIRDPSAVAQIGKEVYEIAQNPKEYAFKIMGQIEGRVKQQLSSSIKQYLPNMCESLIETLLCLLTNQRQNFKQNMTVLFQDFLSEFEEVIAQKKSRQQDSEILKGPILQLIFDVVYPDEEEKIEELKQKMTKNICSVIYMSVLFRHEEIKDKQETIDLRIDRVQIERQEHEVQNKQSKDQFQFNEISQESEIEQNKQNISNNHEQQNSDLELEDESQSKEMNIFDKLSEILDEEEDGDIDNNEQESQEVQLNRQNLIEQVIFHLIQICKHSQQKSEAELLNEILDILKNRQIIKESETLQQFSQIQDIFTLLLELDDNYGIVNTSSVFKQIRQFLNQTIEIHTQSNYKTSIVTMFEILYECLFSHMQSLPIRKFNEIKKICTDLFSKQKQFPMQIKEEKQLDNNYLRQNNGDENIEDMDITIQSNSQQQSETDEIQEEQLNKKNQFNEGTGSMIAFFSYWLQGSLINIPNDGIKDILYGFSEHFPEYNEIFQIVQATKENSKGKLNKKISQQIKKVQQFFNLSDIIINNPTDQMNKLKKCSEKIYGIKKEFSQFTISAFKLKFKPLTSLSDIKNVQDSEYFGQIARIMKITPQQLIGILYISMNRLYLREAYYCLKIIFTQNKIPESKIQIFKHLYQLLCSDNEKDLNNSLQFFGYSKLGLYVEAEGTKKRIQIQQEEFALILLYFRGKYNNARLFYNRLTLLLQNIFGQVNQEKFLKVENCKILFQGLTFSSEIIENQKNYQQLKVELQQSFISITSVEKQGLIGLIQLTQILNLFTFSGSQQNFETLKVSEIKTFSKLLSFRNIQLISGDLSTQLMKDSIQDISSILNIDEFLILSFFNLFSSTTPEKIIKIFTLFKIEPKTQEEIKYLEQCSNIIGTIEEKWYIMDEIQEGLFHKKIPINLFKQLFLFNKLSSDSDTLYFIYDKFFQAVNPTLKAFINFKYNVKSKKYESLQTVVQNVLTNGQTQPIQEQNLDGFYVIIQIFNSNISKTEKIQIFLQYLSNSKKSLLLLIGCLFTYFSGESESINISLNQMDEQNDQNKTIEQRNQNIEQILSKQLDIKAEFFKAIPSLFFQDTYQFAQQYIKFFRQIDYQNQKEELKALSKQNDKELNKNQSQDNKNASENASLQPTDQYIKQIKKSKHKIPQKNIASNENIVNKVTVQDKEVEQFIRLISGNSINTSFFSRELQLPLDIVELISVISEIQMSKNKESRLKIYDIISTNASVQKIFSQIGIQMEEFINCVKFIYADFEINESSSLQKGLKLPSDFSFTILQNLLILDEPLPTFCDPINNRKKLNSLLRSNQLIKDMQLDFKMVSLLYSLSGDFTILKSFFSGEMHLLSGQKPKLIQVVSGLAGCLSKKQMKTDTSDFLKQIHQKLKRKNLLRGNWAESKDLQKQKKKQMEVTEDNEDEVQISELETGNTYEYSIYLLCKQLYISPIWLLLFSGNVETWNEICTTYHRFYKYEKHQYYHNSPMQMLIIVLQLKQCPTLVKELLLQNELAIISPTIYDEKQQYDETLKQLNDLKSKLVSESNQIIQNLLKRGIESFTDLAHSVSFPFKILRLIASYEYQERVVLFQNIKFSDKMVEHVLQKSCAQLDMINDTKRVATDEQILILMFYLINLSQIYFHKS